jgi:hypothetical protein
VLGEVAVAFGPLVLSWQPSASSPPYGCVLLAADYRELARVDGIGEPRWRPPAELVRRLEPGSTYHCYVLAGLGAAAVRSPLSTFTMP